MKGRGTVVIGDALERLRELPDGSVDCVITSPPYFQLRDYGIDGQLGQVEFPRFGGHGLIMRREPWVNS